MKTPDKNLVSVCGERPLGIRTFGELIAEPDTADTLKITDSADGIVHVKRIAGGREDCCDVNNHCANIRVECELWQPQGDYVITCKGGSRNITFSGLVRGHGKVVDVDLGNVSDQSDDLTTGIRLNLVHEAGEPITVRLLGATAPILVNGLVQNYRFTCRLPGFWRSLFLKAYKQLKKFLPL